MPMLTRRRTLALLVVGGSALCAGGASGHEVKAGDLVIEHPWIRATPAGATVAGGYLEIRNAGSAPDRLHSASAPFAKRVEIHETAIEGDVATMRPVDQVDVPAGGAVALKPASAHLMFIDIDGPLMEDTTVTGTLTFERAGAFEVEFVVVPVTYRVPPSGHPGHEQDQSGGHDHSGG